VRNLSGLLSFKLGGSVESGVARSLVAIIEARGDQPPADLIRMSDAAA
jgi:hypothetical protein